MVDIALAPHEMAIAAWVGVRRNIESRRRGLRTSHGYEGDGWGVNIEGAGGELAAAKALNRYWDGSVNTFKNPDLPGLQIRTRSRHDYELLVRPDDSPDDVYVLVTGQMPNYRIQGWARGSDVMLPQYLKEYGGRPAAYFVPASKLQPIENLPSRETN